MPFVDKLRGTSEEIFQVGLSGAQVKNNAGILEIRNADDNGYAKLRAAAPVGDFDVVTLKFFESVKGTVIISRQADCSVALPANTAVRGFVIVTTPGTGTVVGDLLFDDGSAVGTMEIIAKMEGRTVAITDALTGGQITFEADSIYVWDEDSTTWIKIGDVGSVTGAIRCIRYALTNAATQDSSTQVPANARVLRRRIEITTAYSGGATIQMGNTTTANLLMSTTDVKPQVVGIYQVQGDTGIGGSASVIRVAVGAVPAAGAGFASVEYTLPNG